MMNEPQLMMFEQINNNSGTELWTVKRPNFCQIGVLASDTGCFKCASQGSCLLGPWGPADGSEHIRPGRNRASAPAWPSHPRFTFTNTFSNNKVTPYYVPGTLPSFFTCLCHSICMTTPQELGLLSPCFAKVEGHAH